MKRRLRALKGRMSLAQLFAAVSFSVIVTGTVVIGWWVSEEIKQGVIQNTAVTTALYMNSFVAPEVQELAHQQDLSAESRAVLDYLHRETPLGQQIVSFKIWGPGGRIVYSSRSSIFGKVFPETPNLKRAWQGMVTSELSDLVDEEDALERDFGSRLLELYSPVREKGSDRIIAVAEFYKSAKLFETQLFNAQVSSWLVVSGVSFVMFLLLFGIVRRGSQTIDTQQRELHSQVQELSDLLAQNRQLHERVQRASNRATEVNERFLRRVSAELHDGPAQSIGFALLRLDAVLDETGNHSSAETLAATNTQDPTIIRGALNDALQEIRNLSAGLALPELGQLSLEQTLERVTRAHRRRTGTEVELTLEKTPGRLRLPLKIATYRFVQESLNNAYHHGEGKEQRVRVTCDNQHLVIAVSDHGPGFDTAQLNLLTERLGLAGMRERIESMGGRFSIISTPGQGTLVMASLPLGIMETEDVQ
ncbi:sensor histidine kinase [Sedimenticola sp.]|uniref:sensor histidine kinase n=1 Tax=Sedimenticola sp. TaxID=1940285 RepID=UPI003D0C8ACB